VCRNDPLPRPKTPVPSDFSIDPDIARAETLPSALYHAPRWYELQRERIFARSWQPVPDAGNLKAPGHVRPFTLLEGCLDEPLVLVRDRGGVLRCLSNVCTHRGALVVEGEGHRKSLRCRYHGRRFGLDGSFQQMPEFEGVEGFPRSEDDLPELPLERWGPFRFTSLDPAFPFREWIAPIEERTAWMDVGGFDFRADLSREYTIDAHWALYCDNYLEEFHIPYVHAASLGGKLDYDRYHTVRFSWGNLQFGYGTADYELFDLPPEHPDHGEPLAAFYFWLFPNLMLNFYAWGLSANVVRPLGPERTRISFLTFLRDEDRWSEASGRLLHRVEMEDEEVVESVQRGVRSRLYDRGRYSPRREVGTHHFHELLTELLNRGDER